VANNSYNTEKRGSWIEGGVTYIERLAFITKSKNGILSSTLINPATIGQCTGLRDKNGILIFEGDIVKLDITTIRIGGLPPSHDYTLYAKVKWHDDRAAWGLDNEGWGDVELASDYDDIEAIGNIHDTPELLEGETNGNNP